MKKSFIKKIIFFAFLLSQIIPNCYAIDSKINVINFDDILKQAKVQSYDIQIADFNVFIAKQGVRTARSEYFPKINASVGTEYTKNFNDLLDYSGISAAFLRAVCDLNNNRALPEHIILPQDYVHVSINKC
jgi:hypothetical protein